jgi:hypothetical protein
MARVRALLQQLREMLEKNGEQHFVREIDVALAGDDTALWTFLTSNELWGGAGSIADQGCGRSRNTRRPLEELLVELGREQLALERINPRTQTWTSVFEKWHAQNI